MNGFVYLKDIDEIFTILLFSLGIFYLLGEYTILCFFTPVSQSNLRYGIEFGEENLMSHNTSDVFLQKITMCLSYSNWVHL